MTMRFFCFLCSATLALNFCTLQCFAQQAEKPRQDFLLVLRLSEKYQEDTAWHEAENAAISAHFSKLQTLEKSGKLTLAGRTLVRQSMGIAVLKNMTEAEAQKILADDDAIRAGIMTGEILPFQTLLPAAK